MAVPSDLLPIQIPVSPDGNYMLVANTSSATIAVVDTRSDTLVKYLPCDAGCHGINFGAKEGGGYYGYVSNKFSNRMIVVDGDPNGDGDPIDAAIVGSLVMNATGGDHGRRRAGSARRPGRSGRAGHPGGLQRLGAEPADLVVEPAHLPAARSLSTSC